MPFKVHSVTWWRWRRFAGPSQVPFPLLLRMRDSFLLAQERPRQTSQSARVDGARLKTPLMLPAVKESIWKVHKYMRGFIVTLKVYMAVWLSLTWRPCPTKDHNRRFYIFSLEILPEITPVQYMKNGRAASFHPVVSVAHVLIVLWKRANIFQLIAECVFCNFMTKALSYAERFAIFVTKLVFCGICCAAEPVVFTRISIRNDEKCPSHFN